MNFLRDLKADFEDLSRTYFPNTDLNHLDENKFIDNNIISIMENNNLLEVEDFADKVELYNVKEDISEMKYSILNPDNGVIVNTNKNTEYRTLLQANQKDFEAKLAEVESIKLWKEGVTRALWIIFGIIAAIIIRMFMMHAEG